MDRLGLLETFAMTLDTGSLNKAAKRRGISQSAVSQQITLLESLLGQQLLLRTPRGVKPTQAGDLVMAHARSLLSGYDMLQSELTQMGGAVAGNFRLSVSTFIGRKIVGPVLIQLNREFPDLNIVMRVEDRVVDVVQDGYDLAIRSGGLGNTQGVGRKISSIETVLIAAPSYLDRVGRPQKPEDLATLKLIRNNDLQSTIDIPLIVDGRVTLVPIGTGFTVDDPDLMLRAAEDGAGMVRAPKLMVTEELARGQVEIVLPNYQVPNKDVYAVYPSRSASSYQREMVLSRIADQLDLMLK